MIDDDLKFFRENFSASSLSDFQETPKKHPLFETKNNRLNVPQPRKYVREVHYHRQEERQPLKPDIVRDDAKIFSSKATQFKMLHKLKNQHEEIKHLHAHSRQQSSAWMQQSEKGSQPDRYKFKAQRSKRKEPQQERRTKWVVSQAQDKQAKKSLQPKQRQRQSNPENSKTRQLQGRIQEKQRLIKKLRGSEQQIVEQYKAQIKLLKGQIDKLVQENTGLKRDLVIKEAECQQLKEQLKIKQSEHKSVLQIELQSMRERQREHLQTIKRLQSKETATIEPIPNLEMAAEINYLKQALHENNQAWQLKLQQAVQRQRKISLQNAQKLIASQIPPTPMSQSGVHEAANFQSIGNEHIRYYTKSPTPPLSSSNYPNINVRPPGYQPPSRGQRIVQMLVQELQNLRKPVNPIEEQLRNIKDSIKALMRRTDISTGKQYKDLAVTTDSLHMVSELENLKMYVIKQQNARKNYTEELTFYRNQHTALIQQNKQLKTLSTSLEESLNSANSELHELNTTVVEMRAKLDQKSRYIEQLANSLANIQIHQIDSYTKIKTNVDKQRNHQLETQVERLRSLLQSQVLQLNTTHDEKVRGLQHHIQSQERKIKDQQEAIKTAKQQLRQSETQLRALAEKSTKDIAILRQANQRLQQQGLSYKTQFVALTSNNQQLQTQVRERSHAIDHLWMVKQAEFDNIMGQLARLRQGFI